MVFVVVSGGGCSFPLKFANLKFIQPSISLRVYGIRHHGPGSAQALVRALEAQRPDVVLVEGPVDAQPVLPLVADEEMRPPVALLVYDPADLRRASFFPFAEFSPEWQAARFALRGKISVRFIDFEPKTAEKETFFEKNKAAEDDDPLLDPFGLLARLAGFSDHERWWEATFEHAVEAADPFSVFEKSTELMRELRAAKSLPETEETLLREAFMRKNLRLALSEGFRNVAVVVGAWHAPVLEDVQLFKEKDDTALLKPFLKKQKPAAAWIPYTFERLAVRSGYAAGVQSPVWYQLLFENRKEAPIRWLLEAARLIREQGLDASPAHVIDAARLAEATAALRNLPIAGLEELREAAQATLGHGGPEKWQLVENQLVVGNRMGQVPPNSPTVPLQADFEKQLKSLRLGELLKSPAAIDLDLDLRQEPQLKKSRFLHRLDLLGLGLAFEKEASGREQGSFHEYWEAKWEPEIALRLIERGIWGPTVEEAAANFSRKKLADIGSLSLLVKLLDAVMKADLPMLVAPALAALEDLAALTTDAVALADAVPPLVRVVRYGSARRADVEAVEAVLGSVFPRVCIGLPGASSGLAEEAADEVSQKIGAVNRVADLIADSSKLWLAALSGIAEGQSSSPKPAGLAARLLFDRQFFSKEKAAAAMSLALSRASGTQAAGLWLEGFLSGSGLLLVHQPALWEILDEWVGGLSDEIFREALPLLRRTFSRFAPPERQKLLELSASTGGDFSKKEAAATSFDLEKGRSVLPLLREILGG